eukprot:CAMPEP_0185762244 /NCGR_PEP_ID=MMETSP1174-20130828/21230_1 /TAXON_ID=35687 /ORGANISM="Dictyocha speculum, Strain CCMP1381" /LENGTH=79 /DNA_ID=CAMNT_0028443839 /DNA_START=59 /DNA_END=295 /DNA_ORIENTATION=-
MLNPHERKRHVLTVSSSTGAGAAAGAASGRRNRALRLWDLTAVQPKWAPPIDRSSVLLSPATAATLELHTAKYLDRLRV